MSKYFVNLKCESLVLVSNIQHKVQARLLRQWEYIFFIIFFFIKKSSHSHLCIIMFTIVLFKWLFILFISVHNWSFSMAFIKCACKTTHIVLFSFLYVVYWCGAKRLNCNRLHYMLNDIIMEHWTSCACV